MKRFYLLICALVLSGVLVFHPTYAKSLKFDKSVSSESIERFYDDLMKLVSYDKFRDFYDSYIESFDISYDNFLKEIKQRGIAISGAYDSQLIGWQRKGKKIIITVESKVKNIDIKRFHLALIETKEGLKISSKEFFKICENKESSARRKK